MPITEIVFNSILTRALRKKHPGWDRKRLTAERSETLAEGKGKRPDIVLYAAGGVPVVVETEFMDAPTVEEDASGRLGKTLSRDGSTIEQTIAVRIPKHLREMDEDDDLPEDAEFGFCLLSLEGYDKEGQPIIKRWPTTGWIQGGLDELAGCLELTALSENRMAQGLKILEEGIGQAAGRLEAGCAETPDILERVATGLHQKGGEQTWRMAMAIVVNALTFHRAIVGTQSKDGAFSVLTIDELRGATGQIAKGKLLKHWRQILDEINYWPIFKIASDILRPIPNGVAQALLDKSEEVSADLAALGATSQNDLGGRMFQRLISDRKFLATFYTLPSSAALLAELAVGRLDVDWKDGDALCKLRIADFACGTGALLSAAYQAVLTRHRRCGKDDRSLHAKMMEEALVGTDIMPSAVHLTASVLSSAHPREPFLDTSIVTLPYGRQPESTVRHPALGALDLIRQTMALPLFSGQETRLKGTGAKADKRILVPHGGFDLVIMNPPFTRATNHEAADAPPIPSFAGFGNSVEDQKEMSDRLKTIRVKGGMAGHGNAGLASNFIDIAHAKVKAGGVIALVLPAAFLQGASWKAARSLLDAHYRDIAVVSIAATGSTDRAFSADTGMAEVLVVATRRAKKSEEAAPALFVNLRKRPESILAAVATGREIRRIPLDGTSGSITIGDIDNGSYIRGMLASGGTGGLQGPDIGNAAEGLTQRELRLPRRREAIPLPLATLEELGRRGLYHIDISGTERNRAGQPRGPFDIRHLRPGDGPPTYPTLWGHKAERERRMIVFPDRLARPRAGCEDRAIEAWQATASCLHFNLDFQVNSQGLTACITPEPSIGGRAWPNFLCTEPEWEIPLTLWANTTLGLIAFWWVGARQQKGRAILTISKLPELTVLDPRGMTTLQISTARRIFEEFESVDLLPANEAYKDDGRKLLDRAVLIDLLDLPEDIMEPLDLLRRQWCSEPSVHGGKATRPKEEKKGP